MKSIPTPHTHIAVTTEELHLTFGATGATQHQVTVPVGTQCIKLDGGSNPWVVGNLDFISDKTGMLYSDADIYGIRIPEGKLEQIQESSSVRDRAAIRMR